VKGRKIHALVDTQGLPLRVVIHSAGVQDRDGAALVLDKIRNSFPRLELIWADTDTTPIKSERRSPRFSDAIKGFAVLPRRWVIERTFSWFGRNRRLAKDWENLATTLQAFVALATIRMAIRRPAR
jgi:transposase